MCSYSCEQIYVLLDDVKCVDEDDIANLMNNSDTEFIAEEAITQAASTEDTSLTTLETNLHVVPSDDQSNKKEKNKKNKLRNNFERKNEGSGPKKWKLPSQKSETSCHKYNPI